MTTIIAALLALLNANASAAPSKDEIKTLLQKNPDILIDVLKENKKALFEIVNQAAQEEQVRRQKEEEEKEKRDFEESFKNPKKADVSSKARVRGDKDAKYTLIEYSDFQCPYCSRGYQTVEALRKKYGAKLRFVYKNLPLSFHPQAMPAAQYFEAIALQSADKAWDFHDKMFQNQGLLAEAYYKETAKALGVDMTRLEKALKSPAVKEKIAADMQEAAALGFSGTPGYLLNGIPVRGAYPVEHFDSIIERFEKNGK